MVPNTLGSPRSFIIGSGWFRICVSGGLEISCNHVGSHLGETLIILGSSESNGHGASDGRPRETQIVHEINCPRRGAPGQLIYGTISGLKMLGAMSHFEFWPART